MEELDLVDDLVGSIVTDLIRWDRPLIHKGLMVFTDGTIILFSDNTVLYFGD